MVNIVIYGAKKTLYCLYKLIAVTFIYYRLKHKTTNVVKGIGSHADYTVLVSTLATLIIDFSMKKQ